MKKKNAKVRAKCKVKIVECIYVDFTGMKIHKGFALSKDDGVVHKFMQYCLDNNILSIRGPGGTAYAGAYAYCHRNEHKEKIKEFFEKEDVNVTVCST